MRYQVKDLLTQETLKELMHDNPMVPFLGTDPEEFKGRT